MASLLADPRRGYRCIFSERMELKNLSTGRAPDALASSAKQRRTQVVDCPLRRPSLLSNANTIIGSVKVHAGRAPEAPIPFAPCPVSFRETKRGTICVRSDRICCCVNHDRRGRRNGRGAIELSLHRDERQSAQSLPPDRELGRAAETLESGQCRRGRSEQ